MNRMVFLDPRIICEADNVIQALVKWQQLGLRTSVVTLVGVEGSSPRPIGAQMAVAEDGNYVGYLSGGCFEKAVVTEAVQLMKDGQNMLVRYGKGSTYIDINLPCGSGVDLYFDQRNPPQLFQSAAQMLDERKPVSIRVDLASGEKEILVAEPLTVIASMCDGGRFRSVYLPRIKVLVAGAGAIFAAVTRLFDVCGFEVTGITNDSKASVELAEHGIVSHGSVAESLLSTGPLDSYSAVVLAFHDHDLEIPVLAYALESKAFYIGAMGSSTNLRKKTQSPEGARLYRARNNPNPRPDRIDS